VGETMDYIYVRDTELTLWLAERSRRHLMESEDSYVFSLFGGDSFEDRSK